MARDMSIDLDLPADSDSSVLQEYISEMISHPLLTSPSPNSPLSSLSSILSDFEEDIVQRAAPKLRVKPGVPDPREEMQKLGKARIIKKRKPKKHLTLLPVKRAKPSIKNKSSVGKMKPMTQTPKIEWPRENEGGEVFRRTVRSC
jgi:hypothetical protein